MKKRFSKFLALALAMLMILTAVPVSAFELIGGGGSDVGSPETFDRLWKTFTAELDNGLSVKAEVPRDAFPNRVKNLRMVATAIDNIAAVQEAVDRTEGVNGSVIAAVDITFMSGNKEMQPEKDIKVTITSSDFEGRNGLAVIHLDIDAAGLGKEEVEAENIRDIEVGEDNVVFNARSFSIYAAAEGSGNIITVDFYPATGAINESNRINRQNIRTSSLSGDNTPVYDPGMPSLGNNQAFEGWQITSAATGFDTELYYTIDQINAILKQYYGSSAAVTLSFRAVVVDVTFVTYLDQYGVVTKTVAVPLSNNNASGTFTYDNTYVPEGQNVGLAGWVVYEDNGVMTDNVVSTGLVPEYKENVSYAIPGSTGTASNELVLFPYIKSGHWLTFESNIGTLDTTPATYIAPRFVAEGVAASSVMPADPTRQGYSFDKWYTTANKAAEFDWSQSITEDTTVYAGWNAGTASYKIIFWTQNRNDEYTYTDSQKNWDYYVPTATGVVTSGTYSSGETLTIQSSTSGKIAYNRLGRNSETYSGRGNNGELGYNYIFNSTKTETSKVIRGDGTTVFNVYYDRATITINFYTSYTNGSYSGFIQSFTGLYEHELPSNFAVVGGYPNPGSGYSWAMYNKNVNETWTLTNVTAPTCFKSFVECSETWNIHKVESSSYTGKYMYFMTQNLSGNYVQFRSRTVNNSVTQNIGGLEYYGFTGIGYYLNGNYPNSMTTFNAADDPVVSIAGSDVGSNGAYIYYQRNSWKFDYLSNGTTYHANNGNKIYFEADISGLGSFTPTNGPEGHYFTGWYKDPACTQPYVFTNATMPNNDVIVYAGWEKEHYRIVFDATDGGKVPASSITIGGGNQITSFTVAYGTKINGTSLGNLTSNAGYTFGGWFYDAAHTIPFSFNTEIGPHIPDANDPKMDMTYRNATLAERSGYDPWRTQDLTPNDDSTNWFDPVGNDVNGKLVLYALWREKVVGADGIQIKYDAVEGEGLIYVDGEGRVIRYDPFKYVDGALAFARYSATPDDSNQQFLYWEILDKNGNVVRKVYPGQTFPVDIDWATMEDLVATYTITWIFYDSNGVQREATTTVNEGDTPSYPTPPSYSDGTHYNVFAGWSPALAPATANTTYTATYTQEALPTLYTVTFKDHDGTVIDTQQVAEGGAATAPADPTREGYTFTGWDVDFSNVQSDLVVTAQYQINTYTVTFKDGLTNETIATVTVNYGEAATAPAAPTHSGYTFTGWDTAFSNVTSNLTVTALYESNVVNYTVTYVANGETVGTDTVASGSNVTLPATATAPSGYTFAGWVTAELSETTTAPTYYQGGATYGPVTGNTTLYALYTRTQAGGTVYQLLTSTPSSWAGNYVITNNTTNLTTTGLYVLKGVTGSSSGTDAESASNRTEFASSGITLNGTTLSNVANTYVFTMAASGSYYTVKSADVGSYYGINSSGYLYSYSSINTSYCRWTPAINSSGVAQLMNNNNVTNRYFGWSTSNSYFWSASSSNANVLRLWKETTASDTTYYTTSVSYTVTFHVNGGNGSDTVVSNVAPGTAYSDIFPTDPTHSNSSYYFYGWFTAANGGTYVSDDDTVDGNVDLYAHWATIAWQTTSSIVAGEMYCLSHDSYAITYSSAGSNLTRTSFNSSSISSNQMWYAVGITGESSMFGFLSVGGYYNDSVEAYIGLNTSSNNELIADTDTSEGIWAFYYSNNRFYLTSNNTNYYFRYSTNSGYYYLSNSTNNAISFTLYHRVVTDINAGSKTAEKYSGAGLIGSELFVPANGGTMIARDLDNNTRACEIVSTGVNNYQTRISNNETRDSEVWVPTDTIAPGEEYLIGTIINGVVYLIMNYNPNTSLYYMTDSSDWNCYPIVAIVDGNGNITGVSTETYNAATITNVTWIFNSTNTTGKYTIQSGHNSSKYLRTYASTSSSNEDLYPGDLDETYGGWYWSNSKLYLSFSNLTKYIGCYKSNSTGAVTKFHADFDSTYASTMQLYRKQAATYTVTYNGNGATSGSAPTDSNSPYNSGSTVTVLGNTGNLAKTGYTFNGWNTQADGNGTHYAVGATFTISADTTLYAEWIINTYTVTFKDWDGTVLKTQQVNHGGAATAPADPSRAGYTFTGWDVAFNNVQSDLIVTAQYQENVTPGTNVTYVLVDQPVNGVSYILVADDSISGTTGYAVSATILNTNYLTPVEVTVASDKSTVTVSSSALNGISWTAAASGSGFTWQNVGNGNYLSVTNPANAYLTASSTAYAWVYNSDGSFQNTSVTDGYEYMTYGEPNTNANYYRYTVGPESLKDTIHLYAPARTLTIIYQYANGTTAATTYTAVLGQGASYSVTSPTVNGYTPDQAVVSGTIDASDVTVTVTYTQGAEPTEPPVSEYLWTPTDVIVPGEPYLIGFVVDGVVYLAVNDGEHYDYDYNYYGYTARATLDSDNVLSAHVTGLNDINGLYTDLASCQWTFSTETGGLIQSTANNKYLGTYSSASYHDLYAQTGTTYATGWYYDASEYSLSRKISGTTVYARWYYSYPTGDESTINGTFMGVSTTDITSDDVYVQLYSLKQVVVGETYTVTFSYYNENGEWVTVTHNNVAYGTAITPPEVPEREGYTFTGWDAEGYLSVTESHDYEAQYIANGSKVYTITLRAVYGEKNTTGKTAIVLDANGLSFAGNYASVLSGLTTTGGVVAWTGYSKTDTQITLPNLDIDDSVYIPDGRLFAENAMVGYKLIGWNTMPDGTGLWFRFDGTDSYGFEGEEEKRVWVDNLDRTSVNTHINTLYAMWEGYAMFYHSSKNVVDDPNGTMIYSTYERSNTGVDIPSLVNSGFLYGGYYTDYAGKAGYSWTADQNGNWILNLDSSNATPYIGSNIGTGNAVWNWTNAVQNIPGNAFRFENVEITNPNALPVNSAAYAKEHFIGKTIFIKEVPNMMYLKPYLHYTYDTATGVIHKLWVVSDFDDLNYNGIGFVVNGEYVEAGLTTQLTITDSTGHQETLELSDLFGATAGYLSWKAFTPTQIEGKSIRNYWITPDNLLVTGANIRTVNGASNVNTITQTTTVQAPSTVSLYTPAGN